MDLAHISLTDGGLRVRCSNYIDIDATFGDLKTRAGASFGAQGVYRQHRGRRARRL
jgi:hypothetical protein